MINPAAASNTCMPCTARMAYSFAIDLIRSGNRNKARPPVLRRADGAGDKSSKHPITKGKGADQRPPR